MCMSSVIIVLTPQFKFINQFGLQFPRLFFLLISFSHFQVSRSLKHDA